MPVHKADGTIVPAEQLTPGVAAPLPPAVPIIVPIPVSGPAGPSGASGVNAQMTGDVTGRVGSNSLTALQGYPIALTAPADGDVITWDAGTGMFKLAPQQGGVSFTIDSFAAVGSTLREVGESLASAAFTAGYSVLPASAHLVDDLTHAAVPLTTPFASFTKTGPFSKAVNGGQVTFELDATLGAITKMANVVFTWALRRYYGNAVPGANNEAFIKALGQSSLGITPTSSFTSPCGASEHIYFALPSAYPTPIFMVGGFEGGFELVTSAVSVTVNGIPTNYDIWRTVQTNLGSTNVAVS
jgi:hypothetical protein